MSYKEDCVARAKIHTLEMQKRYPEEIKEAIKNTKIYDTAFCCQEPKYEPKKCFLFDENTTQAIFNKNTEGKIAILNFASYKTPGGKFLEGSMAQEECLCHDSFLYNVLKEKEKEYYSWNCKNLNKALYLNRALYSKNIKFFYGNEEKNADVITCAAPNFTAFQRFNLGSNNENLQTLKSRIKFVLDIASVNDIDTLILGAYGCGVFGQDAETVARIFKELLSQYYHFKQVIFAIPNKNSLNYIKFEKGLLNNEN